MVYDMRPETEVVIVNPLTDFPFPGKPLICLDLHIHEIINLLAGKRCFYPKYIYGYFCLKQGEKP